MAKKPTAKLDPAIQSTEASAGINGDIEASPDAGSPTASPDLDKPVIKQAILEGKSLIAEGKSKADAARAIYEAISEEDKEVIVAAFVEGATLTPKGALTYWYNCRRKASKESKQA